MAYGDGYLPEELEHTEIMFRCEDLLTEWFRLLREIVRAPRGDESAARLVLLELAEKRLEDTALELSLHLKARRLEREAVGPERKEGAA